jgi:hypothetical protein
VVQPLPIRARFEARPQTWRVGPGRAYLGKLVAAGRTPREALRLLRRRLSDVASRALLADEKRQLTAAQDNLVLVA